MPKYLFYGSYTPEGFKGLMEEGGSKRIEAAKQALGSVGGSLEAFYFSFGENDFYILVDLPDNVATTAVTFAGNIRATSIFSYVNSPLVERLGCSRLT